jgi:hypothetical protein
MFAMLLMLLLASAMTLAQATPAQSAPKAKTAEGCCKDCPKDKDGKMACMKDGKCNADCPMMKSGGKDKMACMADGMCTGDCPMKDGKMTCMTDGKCTADCPMMKKENKSTASAEKKGCCAGDKCMAEKMHEHGN